MKQNLQNNLNNFAVCLLTLNPGANLRRWIEALNHQSIQAKRVLIIDSSSTAESFGLPSNCDFEIRVIPRASFDHSGTRKLAAEILSDVEFIVYMTQDAFLAGTESLQQLLLPFKNPKIAAVYGRQIAQSSASFSAQSLRQFNYPKQSQCKHFGDSTQLGIKAPFLSNAFCAYRRSTLLMAGNFPKQGLVSEDMYMGAKLLALDYALQYQASAEVFHYHNFTAKESFQRYFDIGVFHGREQWIANLYGGANSEGVKLVLTQVKSLWPSRISEIPALLMETALKYIAYRLGLMENKIPRLLKQFISPHKYFWIND